MKIISGMEEGDGKRQRLGWSAPMLICTMFSSLATSPGFWSNKQHSLPYYMLNNSTEALQSFSFYHLSEMNKWKRKNIDLFHVIFINIILI